jgi:hypothetical protein
MKHYDDLYDQWKMFAILDVKPEFIIHDPDDDMPGNAYVFPNCTAWFRGVIGYKGKPLLVPSREDAWKLKVLQDKIQAFKP